LKHRCIGIPVLPFTDEADKASSNDGLQITVDPVDYDMSFSACLLFMDDGFRLTEWYGTVSQRILDAANVRI
jgi:hypothetical protein